MTALVSLLIAYDAESIGQAIGASPSVSTTNLEKLETTLRSIDAQSHKERECLIATSSTALISSASQVVAFKSGTTANERIANLIDQCRGDFVMIVQPGDYLEPTALEELVKPLSGSNIKLTACAVKMLSRSSQVMRSQSLLAKAGRVSGRELLEQFDEAHINPLGYSSAIMFRRDCVGAATSQFSKYISPVGLTYLWLNVLAHGDAELIDKALVSVSYFDRYENESFYAESLVMMSELISLSQTKEASVIAEKLPARIDKLLDLIGFRLFSERNLQAEFCLRASDILASSHNLESPQTLSMLSMLALNRLERASELAQKVSCRL